jgi:hypothetical protein
MSDDTAQPPPPAPVAPTATPAWLPPRIPFAGDWRVFVEALYLVFTKDFKGCWPRFRTFPVWHDRRVFDDGDGKEEGFWHLVQKDQWIYNTKTRRKEKERLPEFERAGRLPWARPIIDHENAVEVTVWDYDNETPKGKVVRTYIWLKDHDYVVILERQKKDKGDVFMLITSFYLDFEGKRRDLESRYEGRRK